MGPEREEGDVGEAEAEREETVMPWIWGGIGVLVIAAFVAWLIFFPALRHVRHPAAAAPAEHSASQGY